MMFNNTVESLKKHFIKYMHALSITSSSLVEFQ